MSDFNVLISIIREAMPIVQSGVPAIVGGFVTAMFLRGNTSRQEFEKIKAGRVNEAIDSLVNSRELTLTELVKCKNLLKIAELADAEHAKRPMIEPRIAQHASFDFDWFLRFFEAAGNISSGDMQVLWAKVLSGEVANPGRFSFRSIETLRNLSKQEATLFADTVPFLLTIDSVDRPFIIEQFSNRPLATSITTGHMMGRFHALQDSGLFTESRYHQEDVEDVPLTIENGEYQINISRKTNVVEPESIIFGRLELTSSASEILQILERKPDNDYFISIAKEFKESLATDYDVRLYKAINNTGIKPHYDSSIDIISNTGNATTKRKRFSIKKIPKA